MHRQTILPVSSACTLLYLYNKITYCSKCTFAHLRTCVQLVVIYLAWARGLVAITHNMCLFVCLLVILTHQLGVDIINTKTQPLIFQILFF